MAIRGFGFLVVVPATTTKIKTHSRKAVGFLFAKAFSV